MALNLTRDIRGRELREANLLCDHEHLNLWFESLEKASYRRERSDLSLLLLRVVATTLMLLWTMQPWEENLICRFRKLRQQSEVYLECIICRNSDLAHAVVTGMPFGALAFLALVAYMGSPGLTPSRMREAFALYPWLLSMRRSRR